MRRDLIIAAVSTFGAALLLHFVFHVSAGRSVEENAQSAIIRTVGLQRMSSEVVVVARDDRWRSEMKATSVSRRFLGRMTRALHAAGAKVVLFDSVNNSLAFDGPEADQAFRSAVSDTGAVLAVACADGQVAETAEWPELGPWTVPAGTLAPWNCPIPLIPNAALRQQVAFGNITLIPSAAMMFREVTLLATMPRANAMPALTLVGLLPQAQRFPPQITATATGLQVGPFHVASTPEATRIVSARQPPEYISLVDIDAALGAEGESLPGALAAKVRGRYVLYGITTEEARDVGRVISGETRPLVEVHAALLSDILEGRHVRDGSRDLAFILTLGFGLLMLAAAMVLRPAVTVLALVMGLFGWLGVVTSACRHDLLLPPVAPALSAALGTATGLYRRLKRREREQSLLKSAFGDYVDPVVLRTLLKNPGEHLAMSGQRKEITVLFADLVGYTRMTNALPAEQSLKILRDHVQRVTTIIKAAGGRIDKIIGDGVMAVFNDPLVLEDHARVAVQVAKQLHAAVAQVDASPALQVRIGIATGDAFVGNIGAPGAKIEYTVIGATVNLAARLEGQASAGGTVISDATFKRSGDDPDFAPAEWLTLKGFDEPVLAHRSRAQPS